LDIDGWLRRIGLEQYTQTFRDNAIDDDVLRDLTDDHLRELGLPLGARLKLLKAVAALGTIEQPKVSPEIKPTVPRTDAERRQLTVMFVDLVGSTALSARLDPEDMREIVGAYHRSCAEQIAKAGGFVAKYMGDGVLAYFGYPQAHEHDAERAVLAGLALVEAVPKLSTMAGSPLQVRIGIATGLVVVGDLIGMGAAQEQAVVGDTPNLAARLQALAEPNMVVIADGTRRLLGNLFELRDLGARDLKGIAGPARAWAALRASSVESRFEALHSTNLTALVGREEEFELLLRRWCRAKTGEGQVEHRPTDINAMVDESLNLAYHGARAEKAGFSIAFQRDLDPSVGMADIYPQEITRVLLNLISNGFYATTKRRAEVGDGFEPMLSAATKNLGDKIEIRIRDNGTGIPDDVKEKIFNRFFTTKPSGEGTGRGLSMSHDIIVKQHGGSIDVATERGVFTEFKIVLPRTSQR